MKNLVFIAIFSLLAGCQYFGGVDKAVDTAREKYCGLTTERAVVKTALDPEARAEDWALCIRCTGEEKLSCVGDPKALP